MPATLISREQLREVVESIWSSMLQLAVVPCGESAARGATGPMACVQITGAFNGSVLLLTTDRFARRAASRMLAEPEASVTILDVQDAAAELCNMLGGSLKSLMPRPCRLSLPTVMDATPSAVSLPPKETVCRLRFTCDGEPLEVRVVEQSTDSDRRECRSADLTEGASRSHHGGIRQPDDEPFRKGACNTMRVLIADDSSTMRMIIRRSLKSLNISDTVEATDGQQAVEQFKKGGFGLVLTDWNMPGKSGLDVIREIRELDRQVPIIMVTTEAEKSYIQDAVRAGVSDYLIKPFTTNVLEEKLWRFLEQRTLVS